MNPSNTPNNPDNNPFSDPGAPKASSNGPKISVGDIFKANEGSNGKAAYFALPKTPQASTYQSSGKVGASALPLFLLGAPLAAAAIGALYFWVYQLGNVALFSEMAFGFALGCALWPLIRLGKCRNRAVAGTVAALTALLGYGTYLGLEARADHAEWVDGYTRAIASRSGGSSRIKEAQIRPKVERFLTPRHYFPLWIENRAENGVSLVSSDSHQIQGASSGTEMKFQGTAFWFYLAGQVFLVTIFAILAACGAAGGRFNEEKDRWWRKKTFYQIHPGHIAALVKSAEKGDWETVGKIGKGSKTDGNVGAQVAIYSCPPDAAMMLSIYPPNRANNPFWEGPIPPEGLALFPRIGGKSRVSP